uniref:Uncharacterized protein n=1 Tax=Rhizobium meliloti TaxID=382 RepID=I2E2B3_RHIML|nr:short hypothetical protein [Sinorhizobium meliloti]
MVGPIQGRHTRDTSIRDPLSCARSRRNFLYGHLRGNAFQAAGSLNIQWVRRHASIVARGAYGEFAFTI